MSTQRLLLGDNHDLILTGIRTLLEPYYDVVGTASDGQQLVNAALELKPEIVVLDISMPILNGIEAASKIKAALPSTFVIVLTMHTSPIYLRRALEAGASAYVLKTGATEELLNATRCVCAGGTYVSQAVRDRPAAPNARTRPKALSQSA